MGGNAFKDPKLKNAMRRINRLEIASTVNFINITLRYPGLTYDYIMDNLMGSVFKQDDSGDIDIAINADMGYTPFASKSGVVFPKSALKDIADRISSSLGAKYVIRKGIRGGQLVSAWPIACNPGNGYIQVDFIYGNADWLKFSHWSPGKDVSPYKGVYVSTLLGLLAKMRKEFEYNHPETGERIARVGIRYDLELGLHRQWELQKRAGQGPSKVTPDYWETNFRKRLDRLGDSETVTPRFARIGYIDNPEAAIQILFGRPLRRGQLDTFEKAWVEATKTYPDRIEEMKERLAEALFRSGLKYDKNKEEIVAIIDKLN